MTYRCVKCTDTHGPGNCPKESNDDPVCINCNSKHPASYRGCSTAKLYFAKINKKQPKQQTTWHSKNNTNYFVQKDKKYSEVVGTKLMTSQPQKTSQIKSAEV